MGRRLFKELERSYGFDEVAIVPGQVTINPELTSTKMTIGDLEFEIPIMASAIGRRGFAPLRRQDARDGRPRGAQRRGTVLPL